MSVIKANSNEKIGNAVIEGEAAPLTYISTEYSHKNITNKMAKLVSDKNMQKQGYHQNQQKDSFILRSAALLPAQQISQLSGLAKGVIAGEERGYIEASIHTAAHDKELSIKATDELPMNNGVVTEGNVLVAHNVSVNLPNSHLADTTKMLMVDNNVDINPLTHLTTTNENKNVDQLFVANNKDIYIQENLITTDPVKTSRDLVVCNNVDINPLTHLTTTNENKNVDQLFVANNKDIYIQESLITTDPVKTSRDLVVCNNVDINPLTHLTTTNENKNVDELIVINNEDIHLQGHLFTTDQVETSHNVVADINLVSHTPAVDLSNVLNQPEVDNKLSVTTATPAEQKMADEDEAPLFNTMMVGFPPQNIPPQVKTKFNGNSVQYEKGQPQLSENRLLNMEEPLGELAARRILEPAQKQLKPQIKTEQPHIEHAAKTAVKPVNPQEIGQELSKPIHHRPIRSPDIASLSLFPQINNRLKEGTFKNTPSLLGPQLASHQVDEQQGIKPGIKENIHHHVGEQFEITFAENEPFMLPVASPRITALDNKQISLSEKPTHYFANEAQAATTSSQVSSVEEIDPSNNVMATTVNETMRSSVPQQVVQQKQEVHNTLELKENNQILGEGKQSKSTGRSLTYTFNQWQSSPSVTFELTSKGEFIASTASRDVQLALNENKHLLNHESSVHIRREDERQQQRNRQQHDQQQEED
ncbi:SpaN/EivJ family type III secretion system needle length determinant [Providencia sp. PROV130]|uniref:SpaN/EivJ family type III secretion system needle length determinant n=1 Tax=Providencia sp. PROV130 TaxID=2949840 RepID=UPI00234A8F05|nr:hypothetical protein [Providencia sp. PROV130]